MLLMGRDLTPREAEVVDLVVAGRTSKEAAIVLGISRRTVEFYRIRAIAKVGGDSTADLIRIHMFGKMRAVITDLRKTLPSDQLSTFDEVCRRHGMEPWTWPVEAEDTHA